MADDRDSTGKFTQGHTIQPSADQRFHGIREKMAKAIEEPITLPELRYKLLELYDLSVERGWYRAAHDVLKTLAAYDIGKPSEQLTITDGNMDVLSRLLVESDSVRTVRLIDASSHGPDSVD